MSLIKISADEFDKILESKETCVMIFSKETWSVCKTLAPIAEKVSEEFKNQIKFYSLTVTDPETLLKFRELKLLGVPQTVFFLKGEKDTALPGGLTEAILKKETKKLLNSSKGFLGKLKSIF